MRDEHMARRFPRYWKRALRWFGGVAVAGCALAPIAAAAGSQLDVPRHLNFGNAAVQTSVEYNATLTNRSRDAIHIYGIGVSSETGSFSMGSHNGCTGATLAPHTSCTYGIVYAPVKPGRQVGKSDVEYGASGLAFIKLSAHATGQASHPKSAAPEDDEHGSHALPGKAHDSHAHAEKSRGHGHNK
jgi:hypothetical protein